MRSIAVPAICYHHSAGRIKHPHTPASQPLGLHSLINSLTTTTTTTTTTTGWFQTLQSSTRYVGSTEQQDSPTQAQFQLPIDFVQVGADRHSLARAHELALPPQGQLAEDLDTWSDQYLRPTPTLQWSVAIKHATRNKDPLTHQPWTCHILTRLVCASTTARHEFVTARGVLTSICIQRIAGT